MQKMRKEEKKQLNLTKVLKEYFQGKNAQPLTLIELQQRLDISDNLKGLLKKSLKILLDEELIEYDNKRYFLAKDRHRLVTGTLRVHPKGFGFLQADTPSPYLQDIFIPKHLTQNAVDGDIVEVQVNTEVYSEKGPEGKVVSVLKRSRSHVAGIIKKIGAQGEHIAYVPMLGSKKEVLVQTDPEESLRVGDRVVMKIEDWGSEKAETSGRLTHLIGHISDPSCDVKAAIEEHGIRADFPLSVLNELENLGKKVSASEIREREDLRDLECFTIDPETAKDYDDALSITKDDQGFHLVVHIADVSHYVTEGSELDTEAARRCNSTYLPGRCIPMLPPALSDNLCSLKPNVNRLTVSVFMDFDLAGNLLNYRIARTVIKSKKRFSYSQAKKVLDGKLNSPHSEALHLMVELCLLLKKQRYNRGSIEFAMPELAVIVDEKGRPTGTRYIEYDITHQLVEEYMLKANEVIAKHLDTENKGLTYRVHEEPTEENLKEFCDVARAFGFDLPKEPDVRALQVLFDKAVDTDIGPYLATGFIRRMRMASYSPNNIGHYGLALTHYCHFTSPIRRYVDLVVHRILFGDEESPSRLDKVCLVCSEQERISARAENSVILLKKLRLLEDYVKDNPHRSFKAVVTKIKNFGFFFEILDLMLEGFVHISDLEDDYFIYEERKMRLRGRATEIIYAPGTQIEVMLKDLNIIMMETSWELITAPVEGSSTANKDINRKKRRHRKRKRSERRNRK